MVLAYAPRKRLAELGIEPNRLDTCGCRSHRRSSTPPAKHLLNVVASLSLGAQLIDSSSVIGAPLAVLPYAFCLAISISR